MTPVTAIRTFDGETFRIEGWATPIEHGEFEADITEVYLAPGDGTLMDIPDEAFDAWIHHYYDLGRTALVEAFLAAKAA